MSYQCRYCDFRVRKGTVEDVHAHMRGVHDVDIGRNRKSEDGTQEQRRDFAYGCGRDFAQFCCNLCRRKDGSDGGRKFGSAQALLDHQFACHWSY